jgi:hypothetical protein
MRKWRFVFMLAVVGAAYLYLAQEYLFPEIAESISRAASDVAHPSTNIVRAVYGRLLGD